MTIKYRDDIPESKREPKVICLCGECRDPIYEGEAYYNLDDVTGDSVHDECIQDYLEEYFVPRMW